MQRSCLIGLTEAAADPTRLSKKKTCEGATQDAREELQARSEAGHRLRSLVRQRQDRSISQHTLGTVAVIVTDGPQQAQTDRRKAGLLHLAQTIPNPLLKSMLGPKKVHSKRRAGSNRDTAVTKEGPLVRFQIDWGGAQAS